MARSEKLHEEARQSGYAELCARIVRRTGEVVGELLSRPLAPGLYIVSTPIGNLGDMTLRAISVLARADLVLCEDTRRSRTLFAHFGIRRELRSYHEHNAARERPRVVAKLKQGKSVALIADAGTPLISDPGFKLVRESAEMGCQIFSVPGPSAVISALTVSGLPTESFFFAGFLPAKAQARRRLLEELAVIPATLVLYETPVRIRETVETVNRVLPGREIVIARELTKQYEEVLRGNPGPILERLEHQPAKGEIVLLIAPPQTGRASQASDEDIRRELRIAMDQESLRDAVKLVAEMLKVQRKRVYSLALEMEGNTGHER